MYQKIIVELGEYIAKKLYICSEISKGKEMKWNELRRLAEKNGWYLWRNGSKHDIYRHPEKTYTIHIERHGSQEVKSGLCTKLLKQIGC